MASEVGPRQVLSVNQLDAQSIDKELLAIFKGQVDRILEPLDPDASFRYGPEITAALQFLLWWSCIWKDRPTPGMAMMNLRYTDARGVASPTQMAGRVRWQRLCLAGLSVLVPWIFARIRARGLSRGWASRPPNDSRRRAWALLERLYGIWKYIHLFNLLAFLRTGIFPSVAERLSQLKYANERGGPEANQRSINLQFMNRQLLWDGFTQASLFLLPLLDRNMARRIYATATRRGGRIRSSLARSWEQCVQFATGNVPVSSSGNNVSTASPQAQTSQGAFPEIGVFPRGQGRTLQVESCSFCGAQPALTPQIASCGDTFCYYCIQCVGVEEGDGTAVPLCPKCGDPVSHYRPWGGGEDVPLHKNWSTAQR
uniref:RING-type E3 ubiquitin transferase (cysteine targeting) n=1 Tax=Rhizochromulina marina TaxID=1034831 RepID=A0A7S2W7T0_9STRA|mmetsp:Transcript_16630/g.48534  ORF Transcript_16630/g.48534 Transcript_16630/m.48534 type:complete len:370 (+) Transcript_16630:54-1163(+)